MQAPERTRAADSAPADRLFFGVLGREGMRVSELADADWWQFNVVECTFTATKTKTDAPRMWALQPDVAEAMRIWHDRHGEKKGRPFIDVVPDEKSKVWIATRLRDLLKRAGVTRPELFDSTDNTGRFACTTSAQRSRRSAIASGKPQTWIRDRTADKTMSIVDRYWRELCDLVEGLGWGTARGRRSMAAADDEDLVVT